MDGHKCSIFRFSDVEVRERELHLRRNGEVLSVEPKAFRVLICLLRNPGRLVPKDELMKAAWGDIAVTDNSLTRNIALLRRLLEDDPHVPRFIETVTTVGYRFVCRVEVAEDFPAAPDALSQSPDVNGPHALPEPRIAQGVGIRRSRWLWAVGAAVVAVIAAFLIAWWRPPAGVPVVESVTQLTDDNQPKFIHLVSDGSRIYFNQGFGQRMRIAQVSVTGGPSVPIDTRLANPIIAGAAHDGSALLVLVYTPVNLVSLWSIPLPAGEPRPLRIDGVRSADLFPDGRVVFSKDKDVLIAENDGSNPRKLISFPGKVGLTWVSPGGERILVLAQPGTDNAWSWFEIRADGTGLREVRKVRPVTADECCFTWSLDGKYFLYSKKAGPRWDIWALPIGGGLFRRSEEPIRLTTGPLSYPEGAIPSRDGKQIFAVASKDHGELVRYDMKSHQFLPLLSGISATDATYSQDGKWVAYTTYPDHNLWRSRSDGSERMQLTYPPMEVAGPFISPDGTKVVFDSMTDTSICVIDMNGGPPKKILEKAWAGATWSPDGTSIAAPAWGPDDRYLGLRIVEVATGKMSEVPSSKDKGGAFWLDQQKLGSHDGNNLLTFDLRTKKWTNLLVGISALVNDIKSPDGNYVYFETGGAEPSVQRIRVADRHVETITSLKGFTRVMNFGWRQLGVTPDGSPILTRSFDSQEIYALKVRWP